MKTYEEIRALTDDQLSHELTETRTTLESIYPYKCKEVSEYRRRLVGERDRRQHYSFYRVGDGNCLIGGGEYHSDEVAIREGSLYADSIGKTLARIVHDATHRIVWSLRCGQNKTTELEPSGYNRIAGE